MTLDTATPYLLPEIPGPPDIGQYDPFPAPGDYGQPVPAEAHWTLDLQPDASVAFTSNTPVTVQIYTAAYSVFNEPVTTWRLQGQSDGPTTGFSLAPDYKPYLTRRDTWGVLVIAVVQDTAGVLYATGDPGAEPSDGLLRVFALLSDLQALT